jgi:hypothetical protein
LLCETGSWKGGGEATEGCLCKLIRASQVPGMRAHTFHASSEEVYRLNFEASCDCHYSNCMKRLCAHPRHLTRASELASCKRRLELRSRLYVLGSEDKALCVHISPSSRWSALRSPCFTRDKYSTLSLLFYIQYFRLLH